MVPDVNLDLLALTLYDIGAVQLGKFRLHSGQTSPIYLDLRLLVSFPEALRLATAAYRTILDQLTFDLLAATPYAGLPIGTALSLDMDRPLIYPRKETKSYGTGKEIEGRWEVGQTAVVIDDLVTSGDSILQSITSLTANGLQVRDAVVLIDRQQGGKAIVDAAGYQLHAVTTIDHLLDVLERKERISAEQRALVLEFIRQ